LFFLTLLSTTYVGAQWAGRILLYERVGIASLLTDGLLFGGSLLLFLTVHEFGHYFAARARGVSATLPYYLPFPFAIGTLGAVIRIREPIPSTRSLFDIGAAGPLAGFVIALGLLVGALIALPPPNYILDLFGHDALKAYVEQTGQFPPQYLGGPADQSSVMITVGPTLLYWGVTQFFADVPPMYEMYHYPVLFAAWLGLFFTALNLLPVGQLDGGHILFALVGPRWHALIARGILIVLLASGAVGFVNDTSVGMEEVRSFFGGFNWVLLAGILYLYLHRIFGGNHGLIAPWLVGLLAFVVASRWFGGLADHFGYSGWLIWCLLIILIIKVDHPPVLNPEPLDRRRKILGILSMAIFVLCFSLQPFVMTEG
jgi:membrane-associated protease RseP (regulator of RpoE activity)